MLIYKCSFDALASKLHSPTLSSMADLSFIVGIVGNVISILVFTSPVGTFRRVVKKKSTENFKGLPYVTTLLSTSLWTYYGLLKPGGLLVVTVNGVGSVLQFVYVTLFIIYAPKESRVWMSKLVGILNMGFVGVVIAVTFFAIHGSATRLLVIGFLCAALTVGMYAAPMASMGLVVKTRSVEYMPFSLSFFLFLNGGVWSVYALLVRDYFIGIPNAIGFALGTTQLILYAIYRSKAPLSKLPDIVKAEEEEGLAHLVAQLEMQGGDKSARHLAKGNSLPKASVSREKSLTKIVKALSLTPYEIHSALNPNDHTED